MKMKAINVYERSTVTPTSGQLMFWLISTVLLLLLQMPLHLDTLFFLLPQLLHPLPLLKRLAEWIVFILVLR